MGAILKRELSSYFNSAIAYVVLAAYFFFSGVFFYNYCIVYNSASLSYVYGNMLLIILFIIPIMTMKSFADEKYQRTDQALFTAPVSLTRVVLGKFLGAFVLYAICSAIFLLYAVVISFFATPEWSVILCTFIGLLLFGAALLAINIFISSLTESTKIDFATYYNSFKYGLLSAPDIVFFLSVAGLFVFFTVRVLEKRRWS